MNVVTTPKAVVSVQGIGIGHTMRGGSRLPEAIVPGEGFMCATRWPSPWSVQQSTGEMHGVGMIGDGRVAVKEGAFLVGQGRERRLRRGDNRNQPLPKQIKVLWRQFQLHRSERSTCST